MSERPDDLDRYIATYTPEERAQLSEASRQLDEQYVREDATMSDDERRCAMCGYVYPVER
jgi:hypothetical protein